MGTMLTGDCPEERPSSLLTICLVKNCRKLRKESVMEQIKKKRRIALAGKYVALIGVCLVCLTGCSQVTSKKLVDNAAKNTGEGKVFCQYCKIRFPGR